MNEEPTGERSAFMRSAFGEGVYGWTTRKAMHHFGLADEQQEAWVAGEAERLRRDHLGREQQQMTGMHEKQLEGQRRKRVKRGQRPTQHAMARDGTRGQRPMQHAIAREGNGPCSMRWHERAITHTDKRGNEKKRKEKKREERGKERKRNETKYKKRIRRKLRASGGPREI